MSRRHVAADEPGCTWQYGWDPQRQTFYAHLLGGNEPAQRELARFGTQLQQIGSIDTLMYLMGMRLSAERVAVLEHDRRTDSEEIEVRSGSRLPLRRGALSGPPAGGRASRLELVSDQVR
jgi:hypothetical protein